MTTVPLTNEQIDVVFDLLTNGFDFPQSYKGSTRMYHSAPDLDMLMFCKVELATGFRSVDIHRLKLSDFTQYGSTGFLCQLTEQKTRKKRTVFVPLQFFYSLSAYCSERGIGPNTPIFGKRSLEAYKSVLKRVARVVDFPLGTHSFRKSFAYFLYQYSGRDISLVSASLNHSTVQMTMRYLNIGLWATVPYVTAFCRV